MNDSRKQSEIEMQADAMYREEVFTDNAVGTIRRLTPVDSNGNPDNSRAQSFVGSTQVMTQAGPLPLNFEIAASNLSGAIAGFGAAAKEAFGQTMEELREMQRQQASSIVVPGSAGMGGLGGLGGSSKIRMP